MEHECSAIRIPVILGPTAAGKSDIALRIAEKAGFDIISCDSRQLYRMMDIGTAKPLAEERNRVKHWLIDSIDPDNEYSAYSFSEDAKKVIRDLAGRGKTGLMCGGSGLYFESLRRGIGPRIPSDPAFRQTMVRRAEEEGSAKLHQELRELDPESARRIHPNDIQRIVRALTVYHQTGEGISALRRRSEAADGLVFAVTVLMPPRAVLYERINRRVDEMARRGLWEEFKALRKRGYDEHSPGLRSVGYQELFAVERGTCTFNEALEVIKRNTRHYAKRQMTWFRTHNGPEIIDYSGDQTALAGRVANRVLVNDFPH